MASAISSSNPLADLYREALVVYNSSTPLYLDRVGRRSDNARLAASVTELFELVISLNQSQYTAAYPKLYGQVTTTIEKVLQKQSGDKAAVIFKRLLHAEEGTAGLALKVTKVWIIGQCLQDLFLTLVSELVAAKKSTLAVYPSIPPVVVDYFLYNDKARKAAALKEFYNLRPLSPVGEILYTQLKAGLAEDHLYIEGVEGVGPLYYNTNKVGAFADEAFVASLKARHVEAADGIDEIHRFCRVLKAIIDLNCIYRRVEQIDNQIAGIYGTYFSEVMKDRSDWAAPRLALFHQVHFYSQKLYQLMIANTHKIKEMGKERTGKPVPEVDIAPFQNLYELYLRDHHPFFLKQLADFFAFIGRQVKKMEPKAKFDFYKLDTAWRATVANLQPAIAMPTILNETEAWTRYILRVKTHFRSSARSPFAEMSKASAASVGACVKHVLVPRKEPAAGAGREEEEDTPKAAATAASEEDPAAIENSSLRSARAKASEVFGAASASEVSCARKMKYAERVMQWFEAPQEALLADKYVGMSKSLQDKMVAIHAFDFAVDQYIDTAYCYKTLRKNAKTGLEETLYRLPGMLGKQRGVFEYCLDAEGVCYHRCFKEVGDEMRLGDYLADPCFDYDLEFPSLGTKITTTTLETKPTTTACRGPLVVKIDSLGTVRFSNITLYKINP